ncbi:MAG: cupin domain-containing protein [Clostridia bacterium]|nr:cupin domain-containing protein [Clostridia bacterium]
MELKIGSKLKDLRKKQGINITQLSERSQVSTGQISQIERDLVVPSVVVLWKIAKALDININYFFDEKREDDRVIIRHGDHREIIMNKGNGIYKMLAPTSRERLMDLVYITLKPGATYEDDDLISHDGEECGYVLSGTLTVHIENELIELSPGDSIYFNSKAPHRYENRSDEDCASIWGMTPVFF